VSIVASVVALLALAAAALCAAADGALLSAAGAPPAARGGEGPTGGVPDRTHRALAIVRIIVILIAGGAAGVAMDLAARPAAQAGAIAAVAALVIVAAGEVVPRASGDALGARALASLRPTIRIAEAAVRPLAAAGVALDRVLRRVLPPAEPTAAEREVTAERFRRTVPPDTIARSVPRAILHRVFSLSDTEVHEIMVPRVDVFGIERSTPWSEVLDRVRSSQHARLPVFEDTLDRIVGVLFAKDVLPAVIAGEEPAAGWNALIRPATFIPESKTIDAQLRDFKASGSHIAIVVDEFGGTAGIVTIEDVLEEIVGDIRDEYDLEEAPIQSEDGRRFWVSGRVTLDELSESLGHRFEHEDVSTVGGLIFELVGHVPRAGQELWLDGFRVVVERVVRRRVDRVYFERQETAAPQAQS